MEASELLLVAEDFDFDFDFGLLAFTTLISFATVFVTTFFLGGDLDAVFFLLTVFLVACAMSRSSVVGCRLSGR